MIVGYSSQIGIALMRQRRQLILVPLGLPLLLLILAAAESTPKPDDISKNQAGEEDGLPIEETDSTSTIEKLRKLFPCGQHRANRTTESGGRPSKHRIAGGYEAQLGEYPSYVRVLSRQKNHTATCGGTIISEWLVLTAAHCLHDNSTSKVATAIKIKAGSVELTAGKDLAVDRYCVPKGFGPHNNNLDYALLILGQPIEFNDNIQPACLPPYEIDPSQQAHVVGFGRLSSTVKQPKKLQVLPIKRLEKCNQKREPNYMCFRSSDPNYSGDICKGEWSQSPTSIDLPFTSNIINSIISSPGCEREHKATRAGQPM